MRGRALFSVVHPVEHRDKPYHPYIYPAARSEPLRKSGEHLFAAYPGGYMLWSRLCGCTQERMRGVHNVVHRLGRSRSDMYDLISSGAGRGTSVFGYSITPGRGVIL